AKLTARDLNKDLALPSVQRVKALSEIHQNFFVFPACAVTRKADLNCVKEILVAEGLRQELDSAAFHGLHGHRDVAMPRDEDDRDVPVSRGELALKIETALTWQSDIEHETAGTIRGISSEKFRDRPK